MANFVLIGAAGYIAPRHMQAIKEVGGNLRAAIDPHDSVGILDSWFPDCRFFTTFDRFERYCDFMKCVGMPIDYVVVCSPNYLHSPHCRFGLNLGAEVICEKPLALTMTNLNRLQQIEKETGRRVSCILQLRHHPALVSLKQELGEGEHHHVKLDYITPRGAWYRYSWKGDEEKSGGLIFNIGIHFFDLLFWLFGRLKSYQMRGLEKDRASGRLELEKATVDFFLSIRAEDAPVDHMTGTLMPHRALYIDDKMIDFTDGFTALHTVAYQKILAGAGFGSDDAYPATELCVKIRSDRAHS